MHNPPCDSWEQHVDKAYSALGDHDTYNLLVFTDFLLHTWQDEQIVADPESAEWFEERREESAA
jgi:hypothetical protein